MENQFEFKKTFRYETNECTDPKRILYVLHGYGQLAKFFIRKFSSIDAQTLIVAPEGMHRFYLSGSSGRVGASWMTKEAREDDILDNIEWLNALHDEIISKHGDLETHMIGFSQGGATAARWQKNGKVNFRSLALWACVFPPDLDINELESSETPSFFLIGSEDEFYSMEKQDELERFYESIGYQVMRYEGKHDIHSETLSDLFRQMKK